MRILFFFSLLNYNSLNIFVGLYTKMSSAYSPFSISVPNKRWSETRSFSVTTKPFVRVETDKEGISPTIQPMGVVNKLR